MSPILSNNRLCLSCDKPVKGRSDKKFCDDYCRNNFNNQRKNDSPLVRQINSVLAKNRRILQSFIKEGEETARNTRSRLLEKGFNFKYLTHTYTNKKGVVYYFCYDYGFLPLDGDWLFLVRRKEGEI